MLAAITRRFGDVLVEGVTPNTVYHGLWCVVNLIPDMASSTTVSR
jgi:hypothetical protein